MPSDTRSSRIGKQEARVPRPMYVNARGTCAQAGSGAVVCMYTAVVRACPEDSQIDAREVESILSSDLWELCGN